MIIDTSALVAITSGERDWQQLRNAINVSQASIPAPVLTEFHLVIASRNPALGKYGEAMLARMLADGVAIAAFEHRHAEITKLARDRFGKGNGNGGKLNFGDLLVYAIAKDRNEPVLCTGNDFATTDIVIHPASRPDP